MINHYHHIVSLKQNQNAGYNPRYARKKDPFSDQTKAKKHTKGRKIKQSQRDVGNRTHRRDSS
jgi:hypothetical protein